MSEQPSLSIIIPAYKEAALIGDTLEKLAEFLKARDYGKVEVLAISDGDRSTGEAAAKKTSLLPDLRIIYPGDRLGKGGAVRLGMLEAKGRIRLFMDADLATPLVHLDEVMQQMSQGARVVIAVRNLWSIHKSFKRKLISKLANLMVQTVVLPGIKDSQCGFKAFEATAAEAIFRRQTMTSWSFDVEVLAIARHLRYKISFIEAPDWKDPKGETQGLSGDSPIKVAIAEARDPLKVKWNLLRGRYRKENYTPSKTS